MKCNLCGGESRVIDSGPAGARGFHALPAGTWGRRRECSECRHRWTTVEQARESVAQLERKAAKLDELAAMAAQQIG